MLWPWSSFILAVEGVKYGTEGVFVHLWDSNWFIFVSFTNIILLTCRSIEKNTEITGNALRMSWIFEACLVGAAGLKTSFIRTLHVTAGKNRFCDVRICLLTDTFPSYTVVTWSTLGLVVIGNWFVIVWCRQSSCLGGMSVYQLVCWSCSSLSCKNWSPLTTLKIVIRSAWIEKRDSINLIRSLQPIY